jgi:Tfx family DNA-binding protein
MVTLMRTDEKDMLLTPRQIEVLRLKKKGMTQADIARKMKTTRGNICIIESTAMKNIEKARNTVKFYRAMEAPVWVTVAPGTDIYDVPPMIFKEADRKKIKIALDSAMIVVKLKTEAQDRIQHRVTVGEIDVSVDEQGNVNVC